ncbi:FAD-dependent oxidoreductase [Herbiconiux sp. VKM Ac-2851]|uniref:FAD-dependent oxidoreductase n=1 Tax=Herbiconiux sp. VKM Ac-2851 TaxID=2739025 RepID=UPI001566472D|nr:FAD-dependent oxidoreductase [Herbiconiux sp. VKM Ac-2851]NQX34921.1 FAD-dependent oxidoreductase [Herbiconiux sp. VKM Ac-2851]
MQKRTISSDIVVVGGGLAGVSAAVAAARLGASVSLISNRPVLGGNSSSEVRVWVVGATAHGHQRFARETGIMGELFLENQYRNAEGNPYYWDQVVLDLVRAEPNLTLHLNTDVREIRMHEPAGTEEAAAIASVTGWTMGSEIETTFEAPIFLDCTGDGLVGHLAGAPYRIGREARHEHGESWAPEEADGELLGNSIFFYTKDTGRPSKYVAPSIAKDIAATPILRNRVIRTGDNGCDYWWIEWGGELDTVSDNERIRDELWSVVFGIWDHVKNSGDFDADTLSLEWVGSVPGKREYRRFVGDYTLTQNDIVEQREFDDAVAFGGWSIDLHPVQGVYSETAGAEQRHPAGTYGIPYRSLYSATVPNLLFAGRDISASHIAFGSTRVMATCSTLGQAAGTGAALAVSLGVTPRELGTHHLDRLRQTLAREDAPVVGLRAEDPDDLAPSAVITASNALTTLGASSEAGFEPYPLTRDVGLLLPVDPALDSVTFELDSEHDTEVTMELWGTGRPQNYVPLDHVLTRTVPVAAGSGTATARFDWHPSTPQNAVIVLRAAPGVSARMVGERPYGVLALEHRLAGDLPFDEHIPEAAGDPVLDWVARGLRHRGFAFSATPATHAYRPERITDGLQRPYGGPHLWATPSTAPGLASPEHVQLSWAHPVTIASVRLVFNDDVDEDLINLHHHRTDFDVVPELVTDYRLEACVDGVWQTLAEVTGNRQRHRVHHVGPVTTDALRLVCLATGGAPYASVSAVKAYPIAVGRER